MADPVVISFEPPGRLMSLGATVVTVRLIPRDANALAAAIEAVGRG